MSSALRQSTQLRLVLDLGARADRQFESDSRNQFLEKRVISLSIAGDHEMPDPFERRRQVRRTFQGRVSCDKSDRGYENYTNLLRDGYKISIFLNDVEQPHCLIADPHEGWIMRHQIAGGKPVFVGGVARTEIVKGNVSIRLERQFRAG